MDMSKLSQGQMIAGAGGILLIISLFLSWSFGGSAFDLFSGMDIIMLVIGLAAVAYAVLPAVGSAASLPAKAPGILLLLAVGVLGFTLGEDLEDPYADIGAWLALVASIAIVFGAFETFGGGRTIGRPGGGTRAAAPPPPPPPSTQSGPPAV